MSSSGVAIVTILQPVCHSLSVSQETIQQHKHPIHTYKTHLASSATCVGGKWDYGCGGVEMWVERWDVLQIGIVLLAVKREHLQGVMDTVSMSSRNYGCKLPAGRTHGERIDRGHEHRHGENGEQCIATRRKTPICNNHRSGLRTMKGFQLGKRNEKRNVLGHTEVNY